MFSSSSLAGIQGRTCLEAANACVRHGLHYHPPVQEAAGYIVYVAEATGPRFLLLRNASHHTWGFPKGKLEPGEDAHAGALRELREETSIEKIHPDDDFTAESVYEVKHGRKHADLRTTTTSPR